MKRWLLLALWCALTPFAASAQVTISGNIKDAGAVNVTSQNSFVRFTLTGFGGNIPRVTGTNVIASIPPKDFHPDANGNISGTIQGNDTITVGGASQPGGTWYSVCIYTQGTVFRCAPYTITGSTFNLNNATPNTTTPTIPAPTGDNTYFRKDAGNSPITGATTINNSLTVSGAATFTGTINCTIVNAVRCIGPGNPQGWAGADPGAQVNSAIANCVTSCEIDIAAGSYSASTTVTYTNGVKLHGAGVNATLWSYTGSGTAFSMQNVSGCDFDNINLSLSNASAIGIKVYTVQSTYLHNTVTQFRISGTSSKLIWVTGDGAATQSNETFISQGGLFGFASTGIQVDHAIDTFITDVYAYGTANNTTAQNIVIDRGVSGLYLKNVSTGFGLHGVVVQNTSAGGAYGAQPVFLFFDQVLADTTTGGDAWLFASNLAGTLSTHITNSWAAGAGLNTGFTVTTAGSNGFHISGGSGISISNSRVRSNSGNGVLIDGAGVINVRIEGSTISTNNQDGNADQHGIYVTAGATNITIFGNRIGNVQDTCIPGGGCQRYGIKVAAVFADDHLIEGNDLAGNVTGPLSDASTATYSVLGNGPTGGSAPTNVLWGTMLLNGSLDLTGTIQNLAGTSTMGLTLKTGAASNYTGTNTTYASVDTTNLCAQITVPTGWKLMVSASGVLESVTAAVAQSVALVDAGTTCAGGGVTALNGTERTITPPAIATFDEAFHTQFVLTGDGAVHSISLAAKTSNAADAWGIQSSSVTVAPSMTFLLMPSN